MYSEYIDLSVSANTIPLYYCEYSSFAREYSWILARILTGYFEYMLLLGLQIFNWTVSTSLMFDT